MRAYSFVTTTLADPAPNQPQNVHPRFADEPEKVVVSSPLFCHCEWPGRHEPYKSNQSVDRSSLPTSPRMTRSRIRFRLVGRARAKQRRTRTMTASAAREINRDRSTKLGSDFRSE